MSGILLNVQDPIWREFLDATPHDVYHRPGYASHCARFEGGHAAALYAQNGDSAMLIPLVIRHLGDRLTDAVSPYGYATPLIRHRGEGGAALARSCIQAAKESGIVSMFLRLHPLIGLDEEAALQLGDVRAHGETVYVDLTQAPAAIEAGIRKGFRYDIRRLRRTGFTFVPDDWSAWAEFRDMYRETMRRVSAAPEYMFSDAYFDSLRDALGSQLHLATVRAPDDSVAAACLITNAGDIAQYHLSGTADRFLAQSPNKMLLDEAIRWLRRLGARVFHLGGGVGGRSDALLAFKTGFAPSRACFRSIRSVVWPAEFERLTAARFPAGVPLRMEYFPPYRASQAEGTHREPPV